MQPILVLLVSVRNPNKNADWLIGPDRTFEDTKNDNKTWKELTGSDKKYCKNFYNVEFEPLIESSEDYKIIDKFLPLGLHTVELGAFQKVYFELAARVDLEDFEKEINVKKSEYHGGAFGGMKVEKFGQMLTNWNHTLQKIMKNYSLLLLASGTSNS